MAEVTCPELHTISPPKTRCNTATFGNYLPKLHITTSVQVHLSILQSIAQILGRRSYPQINHHNQFRHDYQDQTQTPNFPGVEHHAYPRTTDSAQAAPAVAAVFSPPCASAQNTPNLFQFRLAPFLPGLKAVEYVPGRRVHCKCAESRTLRRLTNYSTSDDKTQHIPTYPHISKSTFEFKSMHSTALAVSSPGHSTYEDAAAEL